MEIFTTGEILVGCFWSHCCELFFSLSGVSTLFSVCNWCDGANTTTTVIKPGLMQQLITTFLGALIQISDEPAS